MADDCLVDVVIPTYGRSAEVVERALASVLSQTINNIAVYVVDDNGAGSELGAAIAGRLRDIDDPRIHLISNDTNCGACVSRNKGILAGESEYIAFLDDDDEWFPEKLEQQLKCMDEPSVGLVYCSRLIVDDDTGEIKGRVQEGSPQDFHSLLSDGNRVGSTSFALVRRACIERAGLFDAGLPALQDYEEWLRVAKVTKFAYVAEPLAVYHMHGGKRITTNPENRYKGLLRVMELYAKEIEALPIAKARMLRHLAQYASCMGRSDESRRLFLAAVRLDKWNLGENITSLLKVILKWIPRI